MPTKKEQTAEKSPKAKTARKKTPTKTAASALDMPMSPAPSGSIAAATGVPAPSTKGAKKPVKRSVKKTATQETASATPDQTPEVHAEHIASHSPSHEHEGHIHELPVTEENISVRAYFIGEHRRAYGIPGSAEEDWHEAERQLRAEAIALSASLRGGLHG